MRSSLLLPVLVSALVAAGSAAYANSNPKPAPVAPVAMKAKPAAAASSSSSSASKTSGAASSSAAAKPKLPDYQSGLSDLLAAQTLAQTNSKDTPAESTAKYKALADIQKAIQEVKSAAAVDKVTVTDTPASTTVAASGSASDSSDDNAQLTLASETLGKANEALLVKAGMTVGEAAQMDLSTSHTDIADAGTTLKSVIVVHPNYQTVADGLTSAETELGKIAVTFDPAVTENKSKALAALKAAETSIASIASTEHLVLKTGNTSGGAQVVQTGLHDSADDRPGAVAKPADASFKGVKSDLEKVMSQLDKGDSDKDVATDLRQAKDSVDLASTQVNEAAKAEASKGSATTAN